MSDKALTVTALTKYIKYKFDSDVHLKNVLLEGEVSNFKHNVRGHFYFTLKDDNAQISAVMFKGNAWKVKFTPKDGMHILVRGYISVFEMSGGYQIYVESMEEVGLGNLYQAYLQLKETLEKEGLFDQRHKQEIPKFPNQIAVLTSSTGAAVRDIIHIINRRYPLTKILIYPTTVQGDNAKYEIVENIKRANSNKENSVIILGRGGGSIEDLWAFNEEMVARAIFESQIPIISAVGHETDFTIADFVADMRAPTPSGAAEIAVPDQVTLHKEINQASQRLIDALKRLNFQKNRHLTQLTSRYILKDPARILQPFSTRFEYLDDKLRILHPSKRLVQSQNDLNQKEKSLHRAYKLLIESKQKSFVKVIEHLEYVNPLSIMKKGYTLAKVDGKILKSIDDIKEKDILDIHFYDGVVQAKIIKKVKGDTHE
ncbi:MAG: exodeoxyribonuclease VII large subunit [Candidatus Izemoplasmataceae bacterium]|jgi:exodeoxyribonuclease VII large subunit|uniref:exodeoxyribonuclease VII large subunit n=1 Tax=Liberiplasma polymorphum TaxID=3374570 RepID=UPI003774F6A1